MEESREGSRELYLTLRERYKHHLATDPEFARYLDRIGQRYYGLPVPAAASNLGQLFGWWCPGVLSEPCPFKPGALSILSAVISLRLTRTQDL